AALRAREPAARRALRVQARPTSTSGGPPERSDGAARRARRPATGSRAEVRSVFASFAKTPSQYQRRKNAIAAAANPLSKQNAATPPAMMSGSFERGAGVCAIGAGVAGIGAGVAGIGAGV